MNLNEPIVHTPEPWEKSESGRAIVAADGYIICFVGSEFRSKTEFEANMKIIKLAPRLLPLLDAAKAYRESIRRRADGLEPLNPAAERLDREIFSLEAEL